MKIKKFFLSVLLFSILLGCGTARSDFGGTIVREAINTPTEFGTLAGVSLDEDSCRSPLVDPRDETELFMVRSSGRQADYEVPTGKYGVKRNELLRINCQTGEVIGIVEK